MQLASIQCVPSSMHSHGVTAESALELFSRSDFLSCRLKFHVFPGRSGRGTAAVLMDADRAVGSRCGPSDVSASRA